MIATLWMYVLDFAFANVSSFIIAPAEECAADESDALSVARRRL